MFQDLLRKILFHAAWSVHPKQRLARSPVAELRSRKVRLGEDVDRRGDSRDANSVATLPVTRTIQFMLLAVFVGRRACAIIADGRIEWNSAHGG
jgi:hypothetical protein